jgi:NitT/TauT family transport system ATP-binding protein
MHRPHNHAADSHQYVAAPETLGDLFVTHDIDEAIFLSDRVYCVTARPGTIKAEIKIPLPRPRQQWMMMSPKFLAPRRGLMSLISEESKAMSERSTTMRCSA